LQRAAHVAPVSKRQLFFGDSGGVDAEDDDGGWHGTAVAKHLL